MDLQLKCERVSFGSVRVKLLGRDQAGDTPFILMDYEFDNETRESPWLITGQDFGRDK